MITKEQCGIIHLQTDSKDNKGGKTIVYTLHEKNILVAIAHCNKTDSYNRKVGVQVALDRLNKTLEEKALPDVTNVEHGIAFAKLPVIDKISMMIVSQEAILKVVNTNLKQATLKFAANFKLLTYGTSLQNILESMTKAAEIKEVKDISKFCLEDLLLVLLNETN